MTITANAASTTTTAATNHSTLDALGRAVEDALAQPPAGPGRDHEITNLDALASAAIGVTATAIPYVPTPPIQNWTCFDTAMEVGGTGARRAIPIRPESAGTAGDLTWSDYFAGAGGSSSGIRQVPGAHVRLAVNHWPLAIETHNFNHPDTDHDVANVARTDPSRYPGTDLGWFSPECFPAGTTILTRRGVLPIEQVRIGDEVLTHKLRWRPVTDVMSKVSDTVVISGYGHSRLETTAEHPFYARTSKASYTTRKGVGRSGKAYRVPRSYGEADWVKAGDLTKGHYWSSPTEFGDAEPMEMLGLRELTFDADFWWMVGRWLGDGCFRTARNEVLVTCGHHEADALEKRLAAVDGLNWYRRDIRTATVFSTGHRQLLQWLRGNFGEHAAGKTMPAWALGMRRDWREALLDGYVSADGGQYDMPDNQRPIVVCSSVSRTLAVGVRLLALSLGHKATLTLNDSRTEGVIEGRTVKMRPLWRVQWSADPSPAHDQTFLQDGIRWTPVREVKPGRANVEVFNLSVAEDESYIVDGLIAHNCTYWSVARGDKCDYDLQSEQLAMDVFGEEETPEAKEARWRSRMLMTDVVRFSRHHNYKGVIVENVPDILKWAAFDRWIAEMHAMGYNHKVIALNSAFANKLGPAAPQLRDRVYIMFWKNCYKRPNFNKWLNTMAWCPSCEQVVEAEYNEKPGKRRPLRYGPKAQYTYRCPKVKCRGTVAQPYVLPAASVIDWSIRAEKIGNRKKPLAKKTIARVQAGINKYAGREPLLSPAGGSRNDTAYPVSRPMRVRTTTESETVVTPPGHPQALIAPLEGRAGVNLRPVDGPLRAQTTRHQDALVQLPPLTVPMRNNGVATPAGTHPLMTFSAGGMHHALVMRNNTARGDAGQMTTPVGEPIRTLTTTGHQSLIQWDSKADRHGLYAYDTGRIHPLARPLTTQTGVEGDAVISTDAIDVDDCTLRMLSVGEIQGGMNFDDDYVLLGNAKRDKVRMLGNAVTPCASRDLAACLMEAIRGDDIPLPA